MPWPVHPTGFLGTRGDEDSYKIERSLRFNSADSAYLSRTPASAGNRRTFTFSCWIKRGSISTANNQEILSAYTGTNSDSGIFDFNLSTSNTLTFGGYSTTWFVTSQLFRDVSAWYHIILSIDSTQSTASNRLKLYVNGSEVTSFSTINYPTLNQDFAINTTSSHQIGRYSFVSSYYFDGYLTEINFIDGQALTPSSFGETDSITGRWKAKAYSGTYGTNGFYLKFADNSGTTSTTLGKDSSGNGNNWTPNNFSVATGADNDSLIDSPTNNGTSGNYATLNPLDKYSSVSASDGNLLGSLSSQLNGAGGIRSSAGVSSGKWYWEVTAGTMPSARPYLFIGVDKTTDGNASSLNGVGSGGIASSYVYYPSNKQNNNSASSYGSSFTTNEIGRAHV